MAKSSVPPSPDPRFKRDMVRELAEVRQGLRHWRVIDAPRACEELELAREAAIFKNRTVRT